MFLTKVKNAAVVVLAAAVLTGGSGTIVRLQQAGAEQPAKQPVDKPKPDALKQHLDELKAYIEAPLQGQEPPDVWTQPEERIKGAITRLNVGDPVKNLLKEQYDAAQTETKARWKGFMAGRETLDIFLGASVRLLQAELDISDNQLDRIAAFQSHWQRMKDMELLNKYKYDARRVAIQDYAQSRFYRARAEVWLERAKVGMPVNPGIGIGELVPPPVENR